MEVLEVAEWRERANAHAARVDAFLGPHLARRESRTSHPVHDFLFTYYSQSPAQLRRWHPGYGVGLVEGEPSRGYVVVDDVATVSEEHLTSQRPLIASLHRLLTATASRPANFGCFGMHEWAMVYRLSETQTRHADWPLRLGPDGTDRVVESHRIACSHFDAYRFFTEPARSLNLLSPGPDDRPDHEQPGCLHAGMDLYGKVAVRLSPLIPSELVADAFVLAWEIRTLDMRAAPYDFTGLVLAPDNEPWTPVPIETPEGKAEFVAIQREFAERAQPIRRQLITWCDQLLDLLSRTPAHSGTGK